MFKSKRADDVKLMPQDIQEDMLTFCKAPKELYKDQIIYDIKQMATSKQEDSTNVSLSQWWDGYEVNILQMEQMETTRKQLMNTKANLIIHQEDIEQKRAALLAEINDNLDKIKALKMPE